MSKVFGHPQFDNTGEKVLTTYDNDFSAMQMDIRLYRLSAGSTKTLQKLDEETAYLLLAGKLQFSYEEQSVTVSRKDVFTDGPYCLHVCSDTKVTITAITDCELLVQSTHNKHAFLPRLYTPEATPWQYTGIGKFGNVAKRRINIIFDYTKAPYSHMALSEVLNDPGNWSEYLPHSQLQPEVCYFKFDRTEGFGASFVGDEVFKTLDGSFVAIPAGQVHPQSVAPGFQLYTCRMIVNLPDKPWQPTACTEDARYTWLNDYVIDL